MEINSIGSTPSTPSTAYPTQSTSEKVGEFKHKMHVLLGSLKDQINGVKGQLGEVNTVVFRETSTKIKLPERIKGYDLFK